jgi:hypothetical protein
MLIFKTGSNLQGASDAQNGGVELGLVAKFVIDFRVNPIGISSAPTVYAPRRNARLPLQLILKIVSDEGGKNHGIARASIEVKKLAFLRCQLKLACIQ